MSMTTNAGSAPSESRTNYTAMVAAAQTIAEMHAACPYTCLAKGRATAVLGLAMRIEANERRSATGSRKIDYNAVIRRARERARNAGDVRPEDANCSVIVLARRLDGTREGIEDLIGDDLSLPDAPPET